MSGKDKYDWPSDEELFADADQVGPAGIAESMGGIPVATVRSRLHGKGWKGRPKQAVDQKEPVSEEEKLRQRVRELESQANRDRKADVFDARIADAIETAIGERETKYSPRAIPKSKRSKTKHEFVLHWSDLHAGEVVSREETNGINSYNWEEMLKRLDKVRRSLASHQATRAYPVEKLHVFALGDMLSGSIHDDLVATNEIPLAEATVQLGMDGAEWLESLTEFFPEIHVSGVVGNHPRAHKKPWAKQGYDNADWTAYRVMELALRKNKRLTFDIPKASQHEVVVAGSWNQLLFHGDGVRSSMVGVPWGGIIRHCSRLDAQYASMNRTIHGFHCGHWHVANSIEGGRINVNGSVKGADEYTIKRFGEGRPPQQLLLTYHPTQGFVSSSPIDCMEKAR